ncbi:hypothetical protein [Deinococcus ruber]|uniref:Uncharacterized protein n=1 Tax=Deinococcus ruber TaxID=1848197 RepID=A0A918C784_9DEIO|nr:hypothetical protein [Deinococcus ruber]GGR10148.1 hypothetical protein GCM10008957_23700 [Deinococcus ruber]
MPKTQWILLKRFLKRGVALGLSAAVVGLVLGYLRGGHTLKAAYEGLNWAALAMFLISGVFVLGQIRENPLNPMVTMSRTNQIPIEPVPWEKVLVCLIAGLLCVGLVYGFAPVIQGGT